MRRPLDVCHPLGASTSVVDGHPGCYSELTESHRDTRMTVTLESTPKLAGQDAQDDKFAEPPGELIGRIIRIAILCPTQIRDMQGSKEPISWWSRSSKPIAAICCARNSVD